MIVIKGWGFEQIIVNHERYCGKKMTVAPNRRCSWHWHPDKDETFFVVSGLLHVETVPDWLVEEERAYYQERNLPFDEASLLKTSSLSRKLREGESMDIPHGTRHVFQAGPEGAVFFEFSTHHDDSDVVRVIPGDSLS